MIELAVRQDQVWPLKNAFNAERFNGFHFGLREHLLIQYDDPMTTLACLRHGPLMDFVEALEEDDARRQTRNIFVQQPLLSEHDRVAALGQRGCEQYLAVEFAQLKFDWQVDDRERRHVSQLRFWPICILEIYHPLCAFRRSSRCPTSAQGSSKLNTPTGFLVA